MPVSGREATHILIGVGGAFAAILIYNHFLPALADVRQAESFNTDIEAAERQALAASTGFVVVTAGLSRSIEVFIIGGAAIILVDFMVKHANAVHPATGKLNTDATGGGVSTSFPMLDYTEDAA